MQSQIKQLFIVFTLIFLCQTDLAATPSSNFNLKVGDLLFQDLNCGTMCNGIGQVTYGIHNTYMSHVGMIVSTKNNQPIIIEAVTRGVVETPLADFLNQSLDDTGRPRVLVERLVPSERKLIPAAVKYAKAQLGKPYNATFIPNSGKSYYCSELIYVAFWVANKQQSIFHTNKMSFKDPYTGQVTADWNAYFTALKIPPPEGLIGTNPGMLSRESVVQLVYQYGNLRIHH